MSFIDGCNGNKQYPILSYHYQYYLFISALTWQQVSASVSHAFVSKHRELSVTRNDTGATYILNQLCRNKLNPPLSVGSCRALPVHSTSEHECVDIYLTISTIYFHMKSCCWYPSSDATKRTSAGGCSRVHAEYTGTPQLQPAVQMIKPLPHPYGRAPRLSDDGRILQARHPARPNNTDHRGRATGNKASELQAK